MMMLDKLLSHLDVQVDPLSLCIVSPGWRLRLPANGLVMIHYVVQGEGSVMGPTGKEHILAPSSLAVVPTYPAHSLQSGSKVSQEVTVTPPPAGIPVPPELVAGRKDQSSLMAACGLVRVRFGRSMGLFDRLDDILTVDLGTYPQVRRAFEGILEEQQNPGPGSEFIKAALMSQSLCYLFRHLATREESPMPWLAALENPQMSKAVDQILDDPGGQHTVESLAETAALSRSAFAKRFHDAFGKPPMNFLHDIRMQRAVRIIQANAEVSIDEVASQVGFQSRSHFSRAFKKYYGISPVEQRDQEAGELAEEPT